MRVLAQSLVALLLASGSGFAQADAFTFAHWIPRGLSSTALSFAHWVPHNLVNGDVRDQNDADFLRFLVQHATNRKYRLTANDKDGIDAIIEREFLVTPGNDPIAFAIYKTEILRRNRDKPGLSASAHLLPGDNLNLPSGPQFAGLKDRTLPPSKYAAELSMVYLKQGTKPEDFQHELVRSAKVFTTFSTAPRGDAAADVKAFEQIRSMGLIPEAVDTRKFPNEKRSHFSTVLLSSLPQDVPAEWQGEVWPSFLPASSSQEIDCKGVYRRSIEILGVAPVSTSTNSKLVLADSGFSNLQGLSRDQLLISVSGSDYSDVDPKKHGTFNFAEITQPFGPVPLKALLVAKVERKAKPTEKEASPEPIDFVWDLPTLDSAVKKVGTMSQGTWIFNISATGASSYSINLYGEASRVLFIAAAGNEGSSDFRNPYAFVTDRSPGNNIMVVGALDQNGVPFTPASYSNHDGTYVDIFAPGSCICGGSPQNNGTSEAAPLVSAAAFMLANAHSKWGPKDIKWSLISTSDIWQDFAPNPDRVAVPRRFAVGGVLNLKRALKTTSTVITSTNTELDVKAFQFPSSGSNPWNSAFVNSDSSHSVLRLHRAKCDFDDSNACFERFSQESSVESKPLPKSTPLRLQLVSGGSTDLQADDIFDIIFPVDYTADKKLVPAVQK